MDSSLAPFTLDPAAFSASAALTPVPAPSQQPKDGEETPKEVADLLEVAYEGRQVWIGVPLAPTSAEDARAAKEGTNLTYGEILSDGLTKLLGPRGLDVDAHEPRCLLELGSGRGRLALQALLQWPRLQRVIGVELVAARHRSAVAAARLLCDAGAGRFTLEEVPAADGASAGEKRGGEAAATVQLLEGRGAEARLCELRMGSLLDLPEEDWAAADVILLEVVMPPGPGRAEAHARLCGSLAAHCRNGCMVVSYEDLHSLWRSLGPGAPPCPFHQLPLCPGGYATSWSTSGHQFHGFRCNRGVPASIAPGAWL